LASASPRRRDLLAEAGVDFIVDPSAAPEVPRPGELPAVFAQRVAADKAREVAVRHRGRFVLGADTVVVVDDRIFGKPSDRNDARRMLATLSGRRHEVLTGVALIDPDGVVEAMVVASTVEFRELARAEIETYLDSGESFDKAGAYGMQGLGSRLVAAVHGSRSNVIGLPMEAVLALLDRRAAIPRKEDRA